MHTRSILHSSTSCSSLYPTYILTCISPDWPRYASHSQDIWKYLDKVCETFDLRKYMTFNTEIIGCYWNEDTGQWTVKLRQNTPGSPPKEFEEKCDLLLHATGILNNFKWPEIEGLEKFKGKVVRKLNHPPLLELALIFQTPLDGQRITRRNNGRMNRLQSSDLALHRFKPCLICSHSLNI
jgi:cation diffusion facilitator CzcD-associated flavoprotein CzcO